MKLDTPFTYFHILFCFRSTGKHRQTMDSKYHLETRALVVRVTVRCENTVLPLSGDRELLPAVHVLRRNLDLSRSRGMQRKAKVVRISVGSSHFNVAVYCWQEHSIKAPVVLSMACIPRELLLLRFTSDFAAVVKLYKMNLSFRLILVLKHTNPCGNWGIGQVFQSDATEAQNYAYFFL